ncbi:unnamed protein product [Parascedosporium putredinis]|uniref:Peptidase M14 domain-containing protein n=1 Tax=Parascedosporium putredinis TaxID=1442378 RepID=A0A9P1H0W1_9PEZI|nr:unnamed protein product [Parascedosporium putredinis]CAI7992488.1 unnamed protein product [Parascedosporium putredinis]
MAIRPKSYAGWKVVHINTERGRESVLDQLASISFDEWNTSEEAITIAVSPSQLAELDVLQLPYTVMHEDLGASITAESTQATGKWKRQVDDLSWFDSYHSYEEHRAYFEELHAKFPNNSEIVSSGTSYEGRDIWGLHFWGANGPGQPAVLWHGTVHAREWIAAPVIEYITRQLILGYGGEDETINNFVNSYDFYVFPFVNPDGFVYTQTTERLWRKSRQPGPGNTTCYGRDINRNWPHGWDANPSGASTDPCSLFYKGEAPGDTPEMQGLSAFVDDLRDTNGIKLFIDWHSYSQYILAPLGHNCTTYIPNLGEHLQIAHRAARAIRGVEGAVYVRP